MLLPPAKVSTCTYGITTATVDVDTGTMYTSFVRRSDCGYSHAHIVVGGHHQLAASLDTVRVELRYCPTAIFIQCTHLEI